MKKSYKMVGIISLIFIFAIYIFITYMSGGNKDLNKNNTESIFIEDESIKEVELEKIVVEIKGEVSTPNVYYMEEGSIVEDLIKEAGGLTPAANIKNINRAKELINHECITIPSINEDNNTEGSSNKISDSNAKININTASAEELDKLPGIGLSRAEDIINYREENNGFKSIEEIKNVSGIGESSFNKMKEKITI